MKKLILLLAVILCIGSSYAQNNERFIEVTGSASKDINPDVITLNISIHEYYKNDYYDRENYNPNQKREKVSITKIESSLFSDLRKYGVRKENIKQHRDARQWNGSDNNYRNEINMENREYTVKVNSFKVVDEIFENVKTKGVSRINVGRLTSSKVADFEDQLNNEALKNGRVKAQKLAAAVGKQIGDVISIVELGGYYGSVGRNSNSYYPANNEKIRISSQFKVRYELK